MTGSFASSIDERPTSLGARLYVHETHRHAFDAFAAVVGAHGSVHASIETALGAPVLEVRA